MAFGLKISDVSKDKILQEVLKKRYPNLTREDEIWHAEYFNKDPKTFMRAVQGHFDTLPTPEAKANYLKAIRDILDRAFSAAVIQGKMLQDIPQMNWFIPNVYPEWWNWFQHARITTDTENWLKDSINVIENVLPTPEEKEAYAAAQVELLKAHGGEDWATRASKETAAKWAMLFLADEIEIQQAAAAKLTDIKGEKMVGFLILGTVGGLGLLALLNRKR